MHTDVHFWGGGGQMYQRRKSPPLSWGIEFAGLSEDEASLLVGFCERHIAENTLFSFCDPVTGAMHDRCAVIPDSMTAACGGINAYEFRATIIEIEE